VKVAEKLQKDPAQVILSWLGRSLVVMANGMIVQRGNVVIPKSSTESRIKTNFDLFELEKEDFDAVEDISRQSGQKRFCNMDSFWDSTLFANETL